MDTILLVLAVLLCVIAALLIAGIGVLGYIAWHILDEDWP